MNKHDYQLKQWHFSIVRFGLGLFESNLISKTHDSKLNLAGQFLRQY